MSTYWVAGREVYLKGTSREHGWHESDLAEPGTTFVYVQKGYGGYAAKMAHGWAANATGLGIPYRRCHGVDEAMAYVEALAALQG